MTIFDVLSDAEWRFQIDQRDKLLKLSQAYQRDGLTWLSTLTRMEADAMTVRLAEADDLRRQQVDARAEARP